jgi:hypothetical protein
MMRLEMIHQEPEGQAHATPLLFVHSMWHGAGCWDEHAMLNVIDIVALRMTTTSPEEPRP